MHFEDFDRKLVLPLSGNVQNAFNKIHVYKSKATVNALNEDEIMRPTVEQ